MCIDIGDDHQYRESLPVWLRNFWEFICWGYNLLLIREDMIYNDDAVIGLSIKNGYAILQNLTFCIIKVFILDCDE